jgi:hypothetical protein
MQCICIHACILSMIRLWLAALSAAAREQLTGERLNAQLKRLRNKRKSRRSCETQAGSRYCEEMVD